MTSKKLTALEALELLKKLKKNNIDDQEVEDMLVGIIEEELKEHRLLKNIEEELEIDLLILFKAYSFGFYSKENNEITYKRHGVIIVGKYLVETKPVYAVKETTLNSSYYGDVESMKKVDDAHYWDWKTCKHWKIKDYGKTWALTREELEDDK